MNSDIPTDLQENFNIPADIRKRFFCLKFLGDAFDFKGRKMIMAYHKTLLSIFYYSFDEDFAWLITNRELSVPDWVLPKVKYDKD